MFGMSSTVQEMRRRMVRKDSAVVQKPATTLRLAVVIASVGLLAGFPGQASARQEDPYAGSCSSGSVLCAYNWFCCPSTPHCGVTNCYTESFKHASIVIPKRDDTEAMNPRTFSGMNLMA